MMRIGLISDTHGLLRPQALGYLEGSDAIVHAGDIGDEAILDGLRRIAPLTVVRGNNDVAAWARGIPEVAELPVGDSWLFAIHDLNELRPGGRKRLPERARAVISGHSHRPLIEQRGPVLYINPGSAGPRRFALPISVGELLVDAAGWRARTLTLEP